MGNKAGNYLVNLVNNNVEFSKVENVLREAWAARELINETDVLTINKVASILGLRVVEGRVSSLLGHLGQYYRGIRFINTWEIIPLVLKFYELCDLIEYTDTNVKLKELANFFSYAVCGKYTTPTETGRDDLFYLFEQTYGCDKIYAIVKGTFDDDHTITDNIIERIVDGIATYLEVKLGKYSLEVLCNCLVRLIDGKMGILEYCSLFFALGTPKRVDDLTFRLVKFGNDYANILLNREVATVEEIKENDKAASSLGFSKEEIEETEAKVAKGAEGLTGKERDEFIITTRLTYLQTVGDTYGKVSDRALEMGWAVIEKNGYKMDAKVAQEVMDALEAGMEG